MSKNAAHSQSAVSPYTEVLILGPRNDIEQYRSVYDNPNMLIIGDGKNPITPQELETKLAGRIDQNTRIDIHCHGTVIKGEHHSEIYKEKSIPTKKLLLRIRTSNSTPFPMHVHLWSCYAGAANQSVQEGLIKHDVLVAHAAEDHSTLATLVHMGITKSISRRKQRRDDGNASFTPEQEFVRNLDLAVDPIRYIKILQDGMIDYNFSGVRDIIESRSSEEYLTKCRSKFSAEEDHSAPVQPAPQDLRARCFVYRAYMNAEDIRQTATTDLTDLISVTVTPDGLSALHVAALYDSADAIDALISQGADVNKIDKNSNTPLHLAVEDNCVKAVSKLLEKGAKLNERDKYGKTPLDLAIDNQNLDIVKLLVAQDNIDINALNEVKKTPLHLAVESGNIDIVTVLLSNPNIQIDIKDDVDNTPLHTAILEENKDIVKALIDTGADVNIVDGFSQTPLHLAVESGNIDIVRALIDAGADVNIVDGLDKTPLHLAVEAGNIDIVTALIDAGADISKVDKDGKTPLDFAQANGKTDVVQYLTRLETAKKIDQQHVLAMRELDQALGISSVNHSTPTSSLERRNPVNRHNIQALARETRHLEQALSR
jgi:ankyrin repeat protein